MCASCGYPAAPGHWTEAGIADRSEKLRARFRRAEILKSVLGAYGLTAHDGGLIPGIQVGSHSGHQVIAEDLAAVWRVAEQLAGRPIDPLDPRFTGRDEVA